MSGDGEGTVSAAAGRQQGPEPLGCVLYLEHADHPHGLVRGLVVEGETWTTWFARHQG